MSVTVLYFSPNGTTKELALRLGKGLGAEQTVDLTPFDARYRTYCFGEGDVAVFAFPSYYDRLPPVWNEIFPRLEGGGARAVGLVSFGNNHYETARAELHQCLARRGFRVVGLGAFVAAHCIIRGVAKGRPNREDLAQVDAFAAALAEKLAQNGAPLPPPEDLVLHELMDTPLAPTADDTCIYCMACAKACPVRAINPKDPMDTDAMRCILCHRCTRVCPLDCRKVRSEEFQGKMGVLKAMLMQQGRENETIL